MQNRDRNSNKKFKAITKIIENIFVYGIICITIILTICINLPLLPIWPPIKPKLKLNYKNTRIIEDALHNFKRDTGVYPIELNDLVVSDESRLKTKVKKHTYIGPYLEPKGGIHGSGIPFCPLVKHRTHSFESIEYNWKYDLSTGKVQPEWNNWLNKRANTIIYPLF